MYWFLSTKANKGLPDFPDFRREGARLVGLLQSEFVGVYELSSFSESEPSELIRDTRVITSGATDLERCKIFLLVADNLLSNFKLSTFVR